MKAYIPNEIASGPFTHSEDMNRIMWYLMDHGQLNISAKLVEGYYREYSEEFWAAGWEPVSDFTLDAFAHWLSQREV